MRYWWILCVPVVCVLHVADGDCTWPDDLRNSTWTDSEHGDLEFSSSQMRGYKVTSFGFVTRQWECQFENVSTSGILMFRSISSMSVLGIDWYLYICMELYQTSADHYKYYLLRAPEENSNDHRVYVTPADNRDVNSVCDQTNRTTGTYFDTWTKNANAPPVDPLSFTTVTPVNHAPVTRRPQSPRRRHETEASDVENPNNQSSVLAVLTVLGVLAITAIAVIGFLIYRVRRKGKYIEKPVRVDKENLSKPKDDIFITCRQHGQQLSKSNGTDVYNKANETENQAINGDVGDYEEVLFDHSKYGLNETGNETTETHIEAFDGDTETLSDEKIPETHSKNNQRPDSDGAASMFRPGTVMETVSLGDIEDYEIVDRVGNGTNNADKTAADC